MAESRTGQRQDPRVPNGGGAYVPQLLVLLLILYPHFPGPYPAALGAAVVAVSSTCPSCLVQVFSNEPDGSW